MVHSRLADRVRLPSHPSLLSDNHLGNQVNIPADTLLILKLGGRFYHETRADHNSTSSLVPCSLLISSHPSSPMTYFPPPSSFNNPPLTSRPPSTVNLSSSLQASTFSRDSSDDEQGPSLGGRTSRIGDRGMDAGPDSPRSRRRGTLDGVSDRKVSDATIKHSRRPSKSLSTPVQGYGATHSTQPPPAISGLGLGFPDQPVRRGRKDDVLSSPRRISTSQAPRTAHPHRSPASLLGAPTHEAYYAQSQPASVTTPRFKDIPELQRHAKHGSSQYPSSSYLVPSPNVHARNHSINSALNSPVLAGSRTPGSVMKRVRKTASAVGLNVGQAENYDGENEQADEEAGDDESLKANGTRVWYRYVVVHSW